MRGVLERTAEAGREDSRPESGASSADRRKPGYAGERKRKSHLVG